MCRLGLKSTKDCITLPRGLFVTYRGFFWKQSLVRNTFFTKVTMNEVEGNTFDGIKQNYSSATRRDMPYGEWVDLPCLFKHWASKYSCSVELQFWPVKMFPANRQTGPEACACSAMHSDLPPNLCFRRHNNCLYLSHAKRGNPTKPQQVSRAIFAQSITLAKVRKGPGDRDER